MLSPRRFCSAAALLPWASEWADPALSVGGRSDVMQGEHCSPLCPECTQPSTWAWIPMEPPGIWQSQQDLPEVGG